MKNERISKHHRLSQRKLWGLGILSIGGQVERINDRNFRIKSQSNPEVSHSVVWENGAWSCNCPDFLERKKPCEHVYTVLYLLQLPIT